MRPLLAALAVLALSSCSSDEPPAESAPTTSSATSLTAAPLGEKDVRACESFVAREDAVYELVDRLNREGSVPNSESVKARLDLLTFGNIADAYIGVESEALDRELQTIADEGRRLNEAIDDGGAVNPDPLRNALNRAAKLCDAGGVSVPWYQG